MAKFGFDVSEVDANAGPVSRDPIPEGTYKLKALEAEEKETSTGGMMIKTKFEVLEGEFKGRWIWQNFNTVNKSEKAQSIGRQQLVAWATACGKPDADDSDKLIEKPFSAVVEIEAGTGGYAASNKIKSFVFEQAQGAAKPAAKATPAKPAPAASGTKSANPWD